MRGAERLLHRVRAGEVGEVIGKIPTRSQGADRSLRGLHEPGGDREEDPARRLREGRRLVPHRRPAALRRRRLLLLRRPHRRHLPLEGRERRDAARWRRCSRSIPGVREANVYGVHVPGRRRPRGHGGARGGRGLRPRGALRPRRAGSSRPTRGRSSCACGRSSRSPAPSSTARSSWWPRAAVPTR